MTNRGDAVGPTVGAHFETAVHILQLLLFNAAVFGKGAVWCHTIISFSTRIAMGFGGCMVSMSRRVSQGLWQRRRASSVHWFAYSLEGGLQVIEICLCLGLVILERVI